MVAANCSASGRPRGTRRRGTGGRSGTASGRGAGATTATSAWGGMATGAPCGDSLTARRSGRVTVVAGQSASGSSAGRFSAGRSAASGGVSSAFGVIIGASGGGAGSAAGASGAARALRRAPSSRAVSSRRIASTSSGKGRCNFGGSPRSAVVRASPEMASPSAERAFAALRRSEATPRFSTAKCATSPETGPAGCAIVVPSTVETGSCACIQILPQAEHSTSRPSGGIISPGRS